jgi:hypothetical protein
MPAIARELAGTRLKASAIGPLEPTPDEWIVAEAVARREDECDRLGLTSGRSPAAGLVVVMGLAAYVALVGCAGADALCAQTSDQRPLTARPS